MNDFASKLEFEDAAQLRDQINRLKAKQMGLSKKAIRKKKMISKFIEFSVKNKTGIIKLNRPDALNASKL